MSPEQATGQGIVDERTDVYSMGAILYRMLYGKNCFDREGSSEDNQVTAILWRIVNEEPRVPKEGPANVPKDLRTICFMALSKSPGDRYDSALALADDLRRWLRDEPIKARPLPLLEKAGRWVRKNRMPAIAISFALLLAILLAAVSIRAGRGRLDHQFRQLMVSATQYSNLSESEYRETLQAMDRAIAKVSLRRNLRNAAARHLDRNTAKQSERLLIRATMLRDRHIEARELVAEAIAIPKDQLAILIPSLCKNGALLRSELQTVARDALASGDEDTWFLAVSFLANLDGSQVEGLDTNRLIRYLLGQRRRDYVHWCRILRPIAEQLKETAQAAYVGSEHGRDKTSLMFAVLFQEYPDQLAWAIQRASSSHVEELLRVLDRDDVEYIASLLSQRIDVPWHELFATVAPTAQAWHIAPARVATAFANRVRLRSWREWHRQVALATPWHNALRIGIDEMANLVASAGWREFFPPVPWPHVEKLLVESEQEVRHSVNLYLAVLVRALRVQETQSPLVLPTSGLTRVFDDSRDPRARSAFTQSCSNFFQLGDFLKLTIAWKDDESATAQLFCLIRGLAATPIAIETLRSEQSSQHANRLKDLLFEIYRTNGDSGIHAAASFALRNGLGAGQELDQIDRQLAQESNGQPTGGQEWYHNEFGAMMIVFRAGQYRIGHYQLLDQENRTRVSGRSLTVSIPRDFAISATELTEEEYECIYRNQRQAERAKHYPRRFTDLVGLSDQGRRQGRTSIVDCMRQMNSHGGFDPFSCFEQVDAAAGEAIVCALNAPGYRLPTFSEWVVAAQAVPIPEADDGVGPVGGVMTPRFFGSMHTPPLGFLPASSKHCPSVTDYLPNRRGMFGAYTGVYDTTITPMLFSQTSNSLLRLPESDKIRVFNNRPQTLSWLESWWKPFAWLPQQHPFMVVTCGGHFATERSWRILSGTRAVKLLLKGNPLVGHEADLHGIRFVQTLPAPHNDSH